jgi:hypothetical protein
MSRINEFKKKVNRLFNVKEESQENRIIEEEEEKIFKVFGIPIEDAHQYYKSKKILAMLKVVDRIVPDREYSIVNKMSILVTGKKSEIRDFIDFLLDYDVLSECEDRKLRWVCPEIRDRLFDKMNKRILEYDEKRRKEMFSFNVK